MKNRLTDLNNHLFEQPEQLKPTFKAVARLHVAAREREQA